VQGLTPTGVGTNVTSGWVSLNGELLPVEAGTPLPYLYISELPADQRLEQFFDGSQKTVYSNRILKWTNTATGNYAYNTFKRLPYSANTIYDSLSKVQTIIKYLVNESAVILNGCTTAEASGNVTIQPGLCLMNGEYVSAPLYNNSPYPVYLKTDGTYTTVDPGGTRIKFDHETSQRYADVIRRLQNTTGMLVMSTNSDDLAYFDLATGLGKWKWNGWKICDLLQSRVPVGYDRRSSGVDGIWDNDYHTVGHKDTSLQNERAIGRTNLPAEGLNILGAGGNPLKHGAETPLVEDNDAVRNDVNTAHGNVNFKTENLGSGTAMDMRQSFSVILFIERL
jgi:hypothetical protein